MLVDVYEVRKIVKLQRSLSFFKEKIPTSMFQICNKNRYGKCIYIYILLVVNAEQQHAYVSYYSSFLDFRFMFEILT